MTISKTMQSFYETYPFPATFQIRDTKYLEMLFPKGIKGKVLEAGCGTGELSMAIALKYPCDVLGFDFSKTSITLAKHHAQAKNIPNVSFRQQDIFDFDEREQYDYIICEGMLHHTDNPFNGFGRLVNALKPKGQIAIGLYNEYGMIQNRIQANFYKTRMALAKKRHKDINESILMDSYANPHRSFHTIAEVLSWFNIMDLKYVGSFYPIEIDAYPQLLVQKLKKEYNLSKIKGSMRNDFLVQAIWTLAGAGMFIISGEKK